MAAADDLADAGDEDIHGADGLVVVVEAHIEGFDLLGVVGDDHRAADFLLGYVTFVLGLKVQAPFHRKFEVLAGRLKDFYGLGVGEAFEVGIDYVFQGGNGSLVVPTVEESQIVGAGFEDPGEDVLEEILGQLGQAVQVTEGYFGFDHPELSQVAGGVGVFGAEGRAEGIDV